MSFLTNLQEFTEKMYVVENLRKMRKIYENFSFPITRSD